MAVIPSWYRRQYRLWLLAFAAGVMPACGGQKAPAPPATASQTITVSGTEHIAWDQSAPDGQIQQYSFVAYVDDVRNALADAVCQPPTDGATTGPCTASLPHMGAGAHRLELATVASVGGSTVESPRSAPLQLIVAAASTAAASSSASRKPQPARVRMAGDGTRFAVEVVAGALKLPSALAVLPDDRVLIAEHSGMIRVYRDGRLLEDTALDLKTIDGSREVGPAGMAIHPRFADNGRVVIVYTSDEGNGHFLHRILRVRALDATLVDPVVLLEEQTDRLPERAPRVRFGPDGKLYVAFPAASEETAGDASRYDGKILRLNEDGSTPADNPGYSPIVSKPHRAPGAFDWPSSKSALWLAERDWRDRDVLYVGAAASAPAYVFDSAVGPSDAAFYTASAIGGFTGNLFIAALDGMHLRRVQFDGAGHVAQTERLLDGEYGRIGDVVPAPDGALYFCTDNSNPAEPGGSDSVFRIVAR